jgi:hypothetical protein
MKAPLNFQEAGIRSSTPTRRLNFKLAIGLACLCLGAGLLLPAIKSRVANHHAMPPGQLQADMRTMIAGVRYLLESEPAMDKPPENFAGRNATLTQHPAERPHMTSTGSPTNPPAPI